MASFIFSLRAVGFYGEMDILWMLLAVFLVPCAKWKSLLINNEFILNNAKGLINHLVINNSISIKPPILLKNSNRSSVFLSMSFLSGLR